MMTSFAFILGVLPLVVAHGAGFEMRRTLGTAVFSGMLGVTLFGIFLTPVFFYVIDRLASLQMFSTGRLHQFGRISLQMISIGFLRRRPRRLPEPVKPGGDAASPPTAQPEQSPPPRTVPPLVTPHINAEPVAAESAPVP
jgi:hypothetical protein